MPNAVELGLIDAPEDQVAREIEQANLFGPAELTRAADVTSTALSELRGATAPRLHLELMVARLLLPASDADEAATRARLDQIERRMAAAPVHAPSPAAPSPAASSAQAAAPHAEPPVVPVPPKRLSEVAPTTAASAPKPPAASAAVPPPAPGPVPSPAPSPSPEPAAPAEPVVAEPVVAEPGVGLDQFVSMWPAVLDALNSKRKMAWAAFMPSTPMSLANGVLAVAVGDPGKLRNIQDSKHDVLLRESIIAVMHVAVDVQPVLAPDRAGGSASSASPSGTTAAAAAAPAPVATEPDAPSLDDDNADGAVGVDLAVRELGATQIGEIEH